MLEDSDVERGNILKFAQSDRPLSANSLAQSLVWILLILSGFLASFTFYQFSNTLTSVRQDLYSLQSSFAALSQHVQDEDSRRISRR